MKPEAPVLILFCGPNGAGKSTLRQKTLGNHPIPFINADEIARAQFGAEAAANAYAAAEIAEQLRQEKFVARESFSFETVLSDPHGAKVAFLVEAREAGYFIIAHFVGVDSWELSRARVIQRVHAGGHDVPDEKIAARYARVLDNLARLVDVPDDLWIYDNSSADAPFRLIARLCRGELTHLTETVPAWLDHLGLPSRIQPGTIRLA